MMEARPSVIAVELIPSLAHDTLRLLSQITIVSRVRHIPRLVYGVAATSTDCDGIRRLEARWAPLPAGDRADLVADVRDALLIRVNTATDGEVSRPAASRRIT